MKAQTQTKFAGRDFPSFFDNDLFSMRRSGNSGDGNPYDPESLLTGGEVEQGFTYTNSRRDWPSEEVYMDAVQGYFTPEEIVLIAPRKLLEPDLAVCLGRVA